MFFVVLVVPACIPRCLLVDDLHNSLVDFQNKLVLFLTCQGTTLGCAVKAKFCGARELPLPNIVVVVVVVVGCVVVLVLLLVVTVLECVMCLLPVVGGVGKGFGRHEWKGIGGTEK